MDPATLTLCKWMPINIEGISKRLLPPIVLILLATGCAGAPLPNPVQWRREQRSPQQRPTPMPVVIDPGEYTFENATGAKGETQKLLSAYGSRTP